jgi:hypothetical protein
VVTGEQIKAARKLLGWTRTRLANRAKHLTPYTVLKAEEDAPGASPPTETQWKAMREVLESAGVEFTHGPPGVRLRRRRRGSPDDQRSV